MNIDLIEQLETKIKIIGRYALFRIKIHLIWDHGKLLQVYEKVPPSEKRQNFFFPKIQYKLKDFFFAANTKAEETELAIKYFFKLIG